MSAPRFNPRACAVVIRGDRVLLHRAERDAFWALPGGRVEPGEFAQEAVVREIREELGLDATAGRLLWLVENFFTYDDTAFQEFGLYFLVEVDGLSDEAEFRGQERHLIFRWFDRGSLAEVDLRPVPLRDRLWDLPAAPLHLCWRD